MRREPLERRKATLEGMLSQAALGIRFNEHISCEARLFSSVPVSYGLEGIVSKRKESRYVSGQSLYWIKREPSSASSEAGSGSGRGLGSLKCAAIMSGLRRPTLTRREALMRFVSALDGILVAAWKLFDNFENAP
jgi:hypothetical protein